MFNQMLNHIRFKYYCAFTIFHSGETFLSKIKDSFLSFIGFDPHSYFRYKYIALLLRQATQNTAEILDIGGSLEFFYYLFFTDKNKIKKYVIAQKEQKTVAKLKVIRDLLPHYLREKTQIISYDAEKDSLYGSKRYDVVFLNDVLEHVRRHRRLVKESIRYTKVDGLISINVPTTIYKRYFGETYHKKIGHVRDGYTLKSLTQIIPEELKLISYKYYCGMNKVVLGSFYSKLHTKIIPLLFYIFAFMLLPFLDLIDQIKTDRYISLNALYKRVK